MRERLGKVAAAIKLVYILVFAGMVLIVKGLNPTGSNASAVFMLLLVVALVETVALPILFNGIRRQLGMQGRRPDKVRAECVTGMIIMAAIGVSTVVYALLYRLMGGSMDRTMLFLIPPVICYVELLTLMPRLIDKAVSLFESEE